MVKEFATNWEFIEKYQAESDYGRAGGDGATAGAFSRRHTVA